MYGNAAILAAVVLIYSASAGRVARSWLSGPILFTAAGLVVGPLGFDILRLEITVGDLKVLAEAALAMVLFTDAAHADLRVVRRTVGLPERLLLIGTRRAGGQLSPARPHRASPAQNDALIDNLKAAHTTISALRGSAPRLHYSEPDLAARLRAPAPSDPRLAVNGVAVAHPHPARPGVSPVDLAGRCQKRSQSQALATPGTFLS
jgi:hypothetical protein